MRQQNGVLAQGFAGYLIEARYAYRGRLDIQASATANNPFHTKTEHTRSKAWLQRQQRSPKPA